MQKINYNDLTQFNIKQILDCGQIFRYSIVENNAIVISKNNIAFIIQDKNTAEILSTDKKYFETFFDLDTDYNKIKQELKKDKFLLPCCEFGYGIRILTQNLFEMIVSFIVSANNNIKRIKNSLNYLSKNFGEKICLDINLDLDCFLNSSLITKEDSNYYYFAFPTLDQLKMATVNDFVNAGLGYRAEYMYNTIQRLTEQDLEEFKNLTKTQQYEFLLSLKGVGEKVANCIMLFTKHDLESFPVDTWINKVYNKINNTNISNRRLIGKELTNKYKNLSGYAQQYFFYYYRENKLN